MARIRSIKPSFWTSEQIVECSPNARLLFIGLLNFADDAGVHPASAARLKMEVFPGDGFSGTDVGAMVNELVTAGLVERYEVEARAYWRVTGWDRHQKIDQPTYLYPLPDGSIPSKIRRRSAAPDSPDDQRTSAEDSANAHQTFDGDSPNVQCGSGVERSGEERAKETSAVADVSTAAARLTDDCPHEAIINLYHETLPSLRRVRDWTSARQKLLRQRWREKGDRQCLDWWRDFFRYVADSDFLMGRTKGQGRKPFDCDLEWLIRPTNFVKVVEGRYQNSEAA